MNPSLKCFLLGALCAPLLAAILFFTAPRPSGSDTIGLDLTLLLLLTIGPLLFGLIGLLLAPICHRSPPPKKRDP